jgi:hypothetical protein
MPFLHWAQAEWFNLLQSLGIVSGLAFTALALRADTKSRRVNNLLNVTQGHREIWTSFYARPELSRVLQNSVDLDKSPVTDEEALFLTFLILHLASSFYAMKSDLFISQDGLQKDIRWFFELPIPKLVWQKSKSFQNPDFVDFVEGCLNRE